MVFLAHRLCAVATAALVCCCSFVDVVSARERYPTLLVGKTLFNQSLDPYDTNDGGNALRYFLDPAVAAPEASASTYEVRVSYLGSPPASYTLTILRASSSVFARSDDDAATPSARRVLLDTERIVFRVADVAALPLLRLEGADAARGTNDASSHDGGDGDVFIVQVESRPWGRRRDGRSVLPRGEGAVFFNIKLEPIVFGVPQTMLPVLLTGIVAVLASVFCLAPRVVRWLEPPMDPSDPTVQHSKGE